MENYSLALENKKSADEIQRLRTILHRSKRLHEKNCITFPPRMLSLIVPETEKQESTQQKIFSTFLDFRGVSVLIISCFIAGWSSLVARWAHNPKVIGSNPIPAT